MMQVQILIVILLMLFCVFSSPFSLSQCGLNSGRVKLKSRGRLVTPRALAMRSSLSGYTSVMIVPTGIGASIGGYAGIFVTSRTLLI